MWKMWKTAGHERGQKKKSSESLLWPPDHREGEIYPLSYGESLGSERKVIGISIVQHTITSSLVGELNIN